MLFTYFMSMAKESIAKQSSTRWNDVCNLVEFVLSAVICFIFVTDKNVNG